MTANRPSGIVVNRRRDRNAGLDPKLPLHVDDVIAEERRTGWRDAVRAEPAEDLGNAVGDRADGRHGYPG
jgi:hypothetical protein